MHLQPITAADLPEILALNQEHLPHVGTLDAPALHALWQSAAVAVQLRDDQGLAGFVLAMAPTARYASPNFQWFCRRGGDFLYVDRIAVARRCFGQGAGRRLYQAVFAAAHQGGFASVTCEVNTLPPNPDSLAFHTRLGFAQVGELIHVPGEKAVAMLEVAVHPAGPQPARTIDGTSQPA
ncbi:MAG: GNAT family N-acetyltransferase [Deltaproteobacteria bacterium]|nr:GNAT family N-acetyltransferase [Deltaproteobacteria bacterium]